MFAPAIQPPFPPAPVAQSPWGAVYQPEVSPFGVAQPPTPPAPPVVSAPAFQAAAAPVWQAPAPRTPAHTEGPAITLPAYQPLSEPEPLEEWQPARSERNVPLGIFIVLVLGAGGWLLHEHFEHPLAIEIAAPMAKASVAVTASEPAPVSQPQPPAAPAPAPVATPEPEVRRAELPPVDLVAAGEAAQRLFLALLEAKTPEARAALIADPEEQSVDLEEFMAAGRPQLSRLKPSGMTPRKLPGQEEVPLFQVATTQNPNGALLRLVPQLSGGFLLDWPLFAESHQRRLGTFLEKQTTQPSWFHVCFKRAHALALSESVREAHLAYDVQASADGSARVVALVPKDTPLGRFLDHEAQWGTVYLARLLLQHREVEKGVPSVVILDCEGAVTGAVFPVGPK